MIALFTVEVRTEHLPNKSQECNRYANPLNNNNNNDDNNNTNH
jgi:hypothetical protein